MDPRGSGAVSSAPAAAKPGAVAGSGQPGGTAANSEGKTAEISRGDVVDKGKSGPAKAPGAGSPGQPTPAGGSGRAGSTASGQNAPTVVIKRGGPAAQGAGGTPKSAAAGGTAAAAAEGSAAGEAEAVADKSAGSAAAESTTRPTGATPPAEGAAPPGDAPASAAETAVIQRDSDAAKATAPDDKVDDSAGADAATMVMRRVDPKAKSPAVAPPQPEPDLAGADDKTVAMPVISKLDAEQTVALPIQKPVDKNATERMRDAGTKPGTDRVVAPAARPGPITKPPSTPRPAAGPKQAGAQGPSQSGPGVEETAPSAPRGPGRPRQVASAPSPADTQQTRPAQPVNGPRPMAQPQRITPPDQQPPAERSKRWLFIGAAAVALIAVIGLAVVLVGNRGDNSPEAKVRATITDYTAALESGDLGALRNTTCGQLHDFYQNIAADQFAGVHQLSMDRKNIPVVASVDTIKVTDKTAIAQATVYTDADPTKRSARTFDLEQTADGWKVCDPPSAGTP
ncbi:hypothetical protein AB0J47_39510 [Nocardia sp. NPDC049737]|uniref:Rv0361 family membrane protein n=1 Tax=Nocardia sp. NPDC049737 TaxID=3154358 RepID=UPI00343C29B4